jgi:hypothetical protein
MQNEIQVYTLDYRDIQMWNLEKPIKQRVILWARVLLEGTSDSIVIERNEYLIVIQPSQREHNTNPTNLCKCILVIPKVAYV